MTRWLAWGALVANLAGVGCLLASTYFFSADSWAPVLMPLPAVGSEVAYSFRVPTSANYVVEADVPAPQEPGLAMRTKPFVPVGLLLRVERDDQSLATLRVQNFRHIGRTYFTGTDLYESNSMVGLARGDYVLRVRTESDAALFRASGVILTFARFGDPTVFTIVRQILPGLGTFLLVIGTLLLLTTTLKVERVRKRGRTERSDDQKAIPE